MKESSSPLRRDLVNGLSNTAWILAVCALYANANYGAALSLRFKIVFWSIVALLAFGWVIRRTLRRHGRF